MKKSVLFFIIMSVSVIFTGCTKKNNIDRDENSQAYSREGNLEDEAVNTLQAGSKYKIIGPMDDLKDAVVEIIGENYWPDTLLSAEELAERTGISENMYDDYLAEYQHTEAGIDMMILIKAKENEIENEENYLSEYRKILLKIYEQQKQNEAKISASRIETIGNYVCYVQLGADITPFEQEGTEKMKAYCLHENERALDIIEKRILDN